MLLLTVSVLKLCRERQTCFRWSSPRTCSNGKLEKLFVFLCIIVFSCWQGVGDGTEPEGSQSHTAVNQPYGKWQDSVRSCISGVRGNLELIGMGMFYTLIYFISENNAVGLFCFSGS